VVGEPRLGNTKVVLIQVAPHIWQANGRSWNGSDSKKTNHTTIRVSNERPSPYLHFTVPATHVGCQYPPGLSQPTPSLAPRLAFSMLPSCWAPMPCRPPRAPSSSNPVETKKLRRDGQVDFKAHQYLMQTETKFIMHAPYVRETLKGSGSSTCSTPLFAGVSHGYRL